MTVRELIEKLKEYPQDYIVRSGDNYDYSEYSGVYEDDPRDYFDEEEQEEMDEDDLRPYVYFE